MAPQRESDWMFAREYELIWIVRPDVADEDITAITDRTSKVATDQGANLLDVDDWGRRKLAYEIQKCAKGHYVRLHFLAQSEHIAELERTLRIDDRILRFLTVKIDDRVDVESRVAEVEAEKAKAPAEVAAAADAVV